MKDLFKTPEIYYCEAPLYGEFFQPLNTISNATYIIAVVLFYIQLRKVNGIDTRFRILATMLLTFGFGSAAWHSFPNFWTWTLDVFPVYAFFLYVSYFIHIEVLPTPKVGQLWFVIFLVWTAVMTFLLRVGLNDMLNGAEAFIAQISYLLVLSLYAKWKSNPLAKLIFILSGVFLVQLFFRQNDMALCHVWPHGLHFLWHTAGAISIYLSLYMIYFGVKKDYLQA